MAISNADDLSRTVRNSSSEIKTSATDALNDRSDRRHSREDALTDREFETLVEATHEIKDQHELEARLALFATGKLGMRGGELAHLEESWIDWKDSVIEIPEHSRCTKGKREGEVCGYCRRRAEEELETNNLTTDEAIEAIRHEYDAETVRQLGEDGIQELAAELLEEVNITREEAISRRWKPKTEKSARRIPFDFDVRVEITLERFFDEYDGWSKSKSTLNRRINRLADQAGIEVYPHALRATAASAHASRGVSAFALMSTMGWSDISTARMYINSNAEQANREIRSKHR